MIPARPLFAAVLFACTSHAVKAVDFAAVAEILENRCLTCHDLETRKGGIDLTPLLDRANASHGLHPKLWIRLEKMVARGAMPPKNKRPLEPAETQAILEWFHQSMVSIPPGKFGKILYAQYHHGSDHRHFDFPHKNVK